MEEVTAKPGKARISMLQFPEGSLSLINESGDAQSAGGQRGKTFTSEEVASTLLGLTFQISRSQVVVLPPLAPETLDHPR